MKEYRRDVFNTGLEKVRTPWVWEQGQLQESKRTQATWIGGTNEVQAFVCYLMHKLRKLSEHDREEICTRLQIPTSLYQSAYIPRAESDTLSCIQRAIPWSGIREFPIGDYRIDLWIPSIRMAVECDENNHKDYDKNQEKEREDFITHALQCSYIQYNPYAQDFNILDVICKLLKRLSCPAHQALLRQCNWTFFPEWSSFPVPNCKSPEVPEA